MKWMLSQIAAICGGEVTGEAEVGAVSIDSRSLTPGSLFVAVRGENRDGHEFIAAARSAGAAAVMTERGRLAGGAGVEVDDPVEGLRQMAIARREELTMPVVAVTGSSGKTTTKDFIAAALGPAAYASPQSYNNELGVPLTILGCEQGASGLVVEVGSRGPGHIAHLAEAIRPDVAVITNVGRAHLEMFGSVENVFESKWELVDALGDEGVAVLPADDPSFARRRRGPLVTFGVSPEAAVAVSGMTVDQEGRAEFTLSHAGESVRMRMPLPGVHQPKNAAAAVAAAIAAGGTFADAAAAIASAKVSPWRMETVSVGRDGGAVTVLNDSYNANPDSMEAALDTVAAIPGRHIAVLGKMHELGDYEEEAHRQAGRKAAQLGFVVIAVGADPGIASGAGEQAISVADPGEAITRLRDMLAPGDVVLVKASRAAGLEEVAAALTEVPA